MNGGSDAGATARAWLLPLRGGVRVAAAEQELLEVLPEPTLETSPEADSVLSWRGQRLPVVDPAAPFHREVAVSWAVVARYLRDDGALGYGAMPLAATPRAVSVHDGLACKLPEGELLAHLVWSQFALSAFRDGGEAIPVLDLARVFSRAGRARLARYAAVGAARCPAEEMA